MLASEGREPVVNGGSGGDSAQPSLAVYGRNREEVVIKCGLQDGLWLPGPVCHGQTVLASCASQAQYPPVPARSFSRTDAVGCDPVTLRLHWRSRHDSSGGLKKKK